MLKLAYTLTKYLLLFLFGFTIACFLAASFGLLHLIHWVFPFVWNNFWRMAAVTLCIYAIAALRESLR